LLDYNTPREPAAWLDRAQWPLLAWLHEQLSDHHARIATWPDELSLRFPDGPPIRVVHGASNNPWKGIYAAHDAAINTPLLTGIAEPVVIAGHTHLAMNHIVDPWQVLNPGTVGVPTSNKTGSPGPRQNIAFESIACVRPRCLRRRRPGALRQQQPVRSRGDR